MRFMYIMKTLQSSTFRLVKLSENHKKQNSAVIFFSFGLLGFILIRFQYIFESHHVLSTPWSNNFPALPNWWNFAEVNY